MKKEKILIADDSEMNRSILADMLSDSYEIIEAEDGVQAVSILKNSVADLSLVLLDIVMPRMDGFGVLEAMNQNGWIEDLPVIIISAETSSSHVERAYELGATDFIARPFDAIIVQRRVVNSLLLYAKQKRLISLVEDQVYEKERQSDLMIDILSHIMEFRNGESGLHILHVRNLTDLLLSCLIKKTDKYKLTMADISLISTASALHDVGKMAIDEKILNKPGKLTDEEFEIMKTHSAIGANMISDLPVHQQEQLVKTAYEICRWHHERWDGRGYPDGLKGDEIPISAQVVSLADVYDALTSERVYKPPFSHEEAVDMITHGKCGVFNPLLLECLSENVEKFLATLSSDPIDELKRSKIRSISEEMLKNEGGGVSKRTLRLLDRERMRNNFYASMTESVQFEYGINPSMITFSGWGAKKLGVEEIIMYPAQDPKLNDILGEGAWPKLERAVRATTPEHPEMRLDLPLKTGDAARWYRLVTRSLWTDDAPPKVDGVIGTAMDIHDSHSKMQELEKKAARDPLTGLLNRASAREKIEFKMLDHPQSRFALAIIDLDDFKKANDIYGHMFGDEVLKFVAKNLRESIRESDVSGRFGGEEFLMFLEYKTDIEKTVDRIRRSVCGVIENYTVSVTVGVALSDKVGLDYEKLLHAADAALYAGKRGGKAQYRFYDDSMKNLLESDAQDI